MTTISAEIVADSCRSGGAGRLTTLKLRYPRWIHAEGRTHRVLSLGEEEYDEPRTPSLMEDRNLSRNASSSRAVPVAKLIDDVMSDPAVPIFWGKNQKGMQADGDEHNAPLGDYAYSREEAWLAARDDAVYWARMFDAAGYAKQIVNRLLEPFSHINVVVTATKWNNFFALRDHSDAEPHLHLLASRMVAALDGSTPRVLRKGEWHLPFADAMIDWTNHDEVWEQIRCSVARCARVSYLTSEGKAPARDADITLFDRLVRRHPIHASPAEHQASPRDFASNAYAFVRRRMADDAAMNMTALVGDLGGNLGLAWVQLRKCLPDENLESLLPASELPEADQTGVQPGPQVAATIEGPE